MYKKIFRLAYKTYGFSKSINEIFSTHISKFHDRIEYAIWMQHLKSMKAPNGKELDYIEFYLKNFSFTQEHMQTLELDLPDHVTIELLDSILTSKMEQFLLTSQSFEEFDREEQNTSTVPSISFATYLKGPKIKNDLPEYLKQLQEYRNLSLENDRKPLYFYLYRLRNNLLHGINSRFYSIKYVHKSLEILKEYFENLLIDQLLYSIPSNLTSQSITQLSKQIEAMTIRDFASDYRLGRNLEEGDQLYGKITSKISSSLQIEQLTNLHNKNLENILRQNLNEETLHEWFITYQGDLFKTATTILDDLPQPVESIRSSNRSFGTLRKIIVRRVLDEGNPEKLIEDAYNGVRPEVIKQVFEQMYEERLTEAIYTVAFHVKDIKAENSFTRLEIENIEFLSGPLFEGWQLGLAHQEKREQPLLFESLPEQKDNHIWVLVRQITAAKFDSEMAAQRAKDKLLGCLGLMYYFVAREDQHNFTIEPSCYAYNHDKEIFTVLNQLKEKREELKSVDELDPSLIELLARFYPINHNWKASVLAAANHYHVFCSSFELSEQIRRLKLMLSCIFREIHKPELLAAASAVFIAGINYDGPGVTYKDMRRWLFEDFREFLEIADAPGKEALKERIIERFKVFCKNIFVTTLLNFDSLQDDVEDATVTDIVEWLFFIYPDSHLIREEN
ncbi:hypothetical protein BBR47_35800 [Brevibacillus brevis NBRC 100599]|uniref:Uncharacterized protein n=1 Tax=Brevibacillus brevis (strain 47 / JCM 6285 / NBRC 100599) TaxID=358681 RepID=C0ZFJ8_BREBN|nr:hypothetical protein [Brevibacillus brevis]BAH44557.1 hypothetical protein BBR47_35800 [Brevibacillus brevis NBRC 100599]